MKKIYLFYFFITIAFAATSQSQNNDFVITSQGDSIPGKGKILNHKSITITNNKGVHDFSAREVKKAFLDGNEFEPLKVSTKISSDSTALAKVLISGFISLYELKYQGEKAYYFKRENESPAKINPKYFSNYVKFITSYCDSTKMDCGGIGKCKRYGGENLRFSEKVLIEVIKEFNTCFRPSIPQRVLYKETEDKNEGNGLRGYVELGGGYNSYLFKYSFNNPNFKDQTHDDHSATLNFGMGVDYQFNKIVVGLDLIYERSFESASSNGGSGYVILPRERVYYSLFGGYNFKLAPHYYFQPFVMVSKYNYVFRYKNFNDNSENRMAYGVGVKLLMGKLYFKAAYRKLNFILFESGTGYTLNDYHSKFNAFSFSIGYRFPLLVGNRQ